MEAKRIDIPPSIWDLMKVARPGAYRTLHDKYDIKQATIRLSKDAVRCLVEVPWFHYTELECYDFDKQFDSDSYCLVLDIDPDTRDQVLKDLVIAAP